MEPKQEEESEEAREARLAEYAAAKAEEDAIKRVIFRRGYIYNLLPLL